MPIKLTTLLLWAAAAAVVVFWVLRFMGSSSAQLPPVPPAQPVQASAQLVAKALGAVALPAAATPVAPSRYALQGVLAGHDTGGGAAVISIDSKAPKAVRVGEAVDEGLILQSLSAHEAKLGPAGGPASMTLQLPKPAIAAFN